jgi:hypothetical protein
LSAEGAILLDAYIETTTTRELSIPDRRLTGTTFTYPLQLAMVEDVTTIRKDLLNVMKDVGKDPAAKGTGGNSRKTMRFVLGGLEDHDATSLASLLVGAPIASNSNEAAQEA